MTEFEKIRTVFKKIFLIICVTFVLFIIFVFSGLFFGSVMSGLTKNVVNENSMIQNYQWFYNQYYMIQVQKANYESIPQDAYEKRYKQIKRNVSNIIKNYIFP